MSVAVSLISLILLLSLICVLVICFVGGMVIGGLIPKARASPKNKDKT